MSRALTLAQLVRISHNFNIKIENIDDEKDTKTFQRYNNFQFYSYSVASCHIIQTTFMYVFDIVSFTYKTENRIEPFYRYTQHIYFKTEKKKFHMKYV